MGEIVRSTLLSSMQYKTFVWPNNPATSNYSCDRVYAKHKYPELAGVDIEDMDVDVSIITGTGEFIGSNAYDYWRTLNTVFRSHGTGKFYHPIFNDASVGLMTKLTADLEPLQDYVKYSFEIVAYTPPTISTSPIKMLSSSVVSSTGSSSSNIKVGDTVICNGYAYYTSAGANPHTALLVAKRLTVTRTAYGNAYPICVGSYGWMKLSDVKLANASSGSSNGTSTIRYVVKPGDVLSRICANYGVDWKTVASYNNIKNPNLIYSGQVITIKK